MASSYPGPVSAVQVGSYFVGQYYQVLKQHPDLVHQFYADASTMIRVDRDSSQSATNIMEIHTIATSLNFTAIEIKTINSLESWEGGILVMVTGSVKTKDYVTRKFVQNFFLAPQEKGYFVLNDIFQFIEEEVVYQHVSPSENVYQQHSLSLSPESHLVPSLDTAPVSDPPVSDYVLVDRAAEYVNSVHMHDDTVDKYSLSDQQQQDYENEIVVEEAPEDVHTSLHRVIDTVHDCPPASEDHMEEAPKRTYASILRVAKGQINSSTASQPTISKSNSTSNWNHVPEPASLLPEDTGLSNTPETGVDTAEEHVGQDEGEPRSVYVRNLPSDVTAEEIEEAFQHFGTMRPDSVFIRNRKDAVGVCYAFVEFEELSSVHNAIKASPIEICGRQVFIEERRPNSGIASRGGRGRGGRGRTSYPADASRGRSGGRSVFRSSNQGNGFYQRGAAR